MCYFLLANDLIDFESEENRSFELLLCENYWKCYEEVLRVGKLSHLLTQVCWMS